MLFVVQFNIMRLVRNSVVLCTYSVVSWNSIKGWMLYLKQKRNDELVTSHTEYLQTGTSAQTYFKRETVKSINTR